MGKATQELKYKRLKVGHACYVCRSKKIKCDGLRPCMQCKARGRNCQSSNQDASTDSTVQSPSSDHQDDSNSHHSNIDSDDDSILFSRPKPTGNGKSSEFRDTWTCNAVKQAAARYGSKDVKHVPMGEFPTFGSFVRWRPEPALPSKYSTAIEMPSSEIQMHLINQFFETRYRVSPLIPKRYFYEQLRTKGPLITPLLLNAIYCATSGNSPLKDVPKPAVFFNRAKKLLDDFLDVPRVSTVAALCMMAYYEPMPTKSKSVADHHCRSWIYSGMAFRMCLELGLNMDTPFSRNNLDNDELELRRRVFWACYCFDKMQSAEWERLWSIPSSLAKTALPSVQPDDDDTEKWIVQTFQQKIKLALLGEEGLQIRASFAIRDNVGNQRFFEQLNQYQLKILQWGSNLPSPEIWNIKYCETIEEVINEPRRSPDIAYFLSLYYFMLSDTLFCLPDNAKSSIQHRIYAAELTRCIEDISSDNTVVVRYEFLAHACIAALRVHCRYLSDPNAKVASESMQFFERCVKILRVLQQKAIIPECSAILQKISTIHQRARELATQMNESSSSMQLNPSVTIPSTFYGYDSNRTDLFGSEQSLERNGNMMQPLQNTTTANTTATTTMVSPGFDPYRSDAPRSSFDLPCMDSMLFNSPYNSLSAFGSSIGVDFSDRSQLWEYALNDNAQMGSQPASPDSNINQPLSTSSTGSEWASPRAGDFIWPDPITAVTTAAATTPSNVAVPSHKLTSQPQSQSPRSQQVFSTFPTTSAEPNLSNVLGYSTINTSHPQAYSPQQQQQQQQQQHQQQPQQQQQQQQQQQYMSSNMQAPQMNNNPSVNMNPNLCFPNSVASQQIYYTN